MCDFQWLTVFSFPPLLLLFLTRQRQPPSSSRSNGPRMALWSHSGAFFHFIPKQLHSKLVKDLQTDGGESSQITTATSPMCVNATCVPHNHAHAEPEHVSCQLMGSPEGKASTVNRCGRHQHQKQKRKEKKTLDAQRCH